MAGSGGRRQVGVVAIVTVVCLWVFPTPSHSQLSIRDLIDARPELTSVKKFLQGTDVYAKLGSTSSQLRLTFFAPHNNAIRNVSAQIQVQLGSMNTDVANQIFLYHTVSGVYRTSDLNSSGASVRLQTLAANGPLVLFFYRNDASYVNGARFIEADISATNGILHIIDNIFVNVGPSVSAYNRDVATYVTDQQQAASDQEKTTEFQILLNVYNMYSSRNMLVAGPYGWLVDNVLNNDRMSITAFIPSDDAIKRFRIQNPDKYSQLNKGNPATLQMVMESHAIPVGAFHSTLLVQLTKSDTVQAMQGRIRMYRYNGDLFVSNNCAQARVTKANTTASNGVVYIIDNVIGFITDDLYNHIIRDYSTDDFRGTILSAPSSFQVMLQLPVGTVNVPDDAKLTVFAPNSNAFKDTDFSQDPSQRLLQLNMHVLHGVLHLYQMTNGTKIETLTTEYFAKFYQLSDGTYVEVDYVRAKIVEADVCTKNGLIHKVDRILGVPSLTISDAIIQDPLMTFLETVVQNTGLKTILQDMTRQLTMFAPIDKAFQQMSSQSPSYFVRLNESKLKNILRRHIGRGLFFLDQIVPLNSETTIPTCKGDITIGNSNGEYYVLVGSRRIRVIRANMRMKNGVMHVVDAVLYDPDDPRTGESISASTTLVPFSIMIILMITIAEAFIVHRVNSFVVLILGS